MRKLRPWEIKWLVHSHIASKSCSQPWQLLIQCLGPLSNTAMRGPVGSEKSFILGARGHRWRVVSRGWLAHSEKGIWVRSDCSKLPWGRLSTRLLELLWKLPWMNPCLNQRSVPLICFTSWIPWNISFEWNISLCWSPSSSAISQGGINWQINWVSLTLVSHIWNGDNNKYLREWLWDSNEMMS